MAAGTCINTRCSSCSRAACRAALCSSEISGNAGNDEMFVRLLLDCGCGTTTHSSEIGINRRQNTALKHVCSLGGTYGNHVSLTVSRLRNVGKSGRFYTVD